MTLLMTHKAIPTPPNHVCMHALLQVVKLGTDSEEQSFSLREINERINSPSLSLVPRKDSVEGWRMSSRQLMDTDPTDESEGQDDELTKILTEYNDAEGVGFQDDAVELFLSAFGDDSDKENDADRPSVSNGGQFLGFTPIKLGVEFR